MKGKLHLTVVVLLISMLGTSSKASDYWNTLFDSTGTNIERNDSALTFDDVLSSIAKKNPLFQSFTHQLQSAKDNLTQAGSWSNPELELAIEEFGWNAPGFKESELSISIAQEFEFFGQKNARKEFALAQIDATEIQIEQSAFKLYLIAKQRFIILAHAQHKIELSQQALNLSTEIVENINIRLNKGAALQSELLLAKIEEQRALLDLEQAQQEIKSLEINLFSLWNGIPSGKYIECELETNLSQILNKLSTLTNQIESSRELKQYDSELNLLQSEYYLTKTEAKPVVTLNGGFKRLELDNSKSYLFGISIPLPFLNKNQGTQKSIQSKIRSLQYEKQHATNEILSIIKSSYINLTQLVNRHESLDTLLIPTANHAFQTLQEAYEAGRIPYTHLLEAERTLNELNFEHNDMLLTIHNLLIDIESVNGIILSMERKN